MCKSWQINIPKCYIATAEVHLHDVRHCDSETIQQLKKLAFHSEVVAIGECGLDYNRNYSPHPDQEYWFEAQPQLACELQLPLFLHERDAHQRFLEILQPHRDHLPAVVVHCFTENGNELRTYLVDLGVSSATVQVDSAED